MTNWRLRTRKKVLDVWIREARPADDIFLNIARKTKMMVLTTGNKVRCVLYQEKFLKVST